MLKMLKVRIGYIVPTSVTNPATKTFNGTEEIVTTASVDGCSVLSETQLSGSACAWTIHRLYQ